MLFAFATFISTLSYYYILQSFLHLTSGLSEIKFLNNNLYTVQYALDGTWILHCRNMDLCIGNVNEFDNC